MTSSHCVRRPRTLDYDVSVGWSAPAYFWQLWEPHGGSLANCGEEPTLDRLVAITRHLIDWRREAALLQQLARAPWFTAATEREDWETLELMTSLLSSEG